MDCEAKAQSRRRAVDGERINAKRRENWKNNPKWRWQQKDTNLRNNYGISLDEWNALFEAQQQKCAICYATTPRGRGWQTDHDHATGKVREILCHPCNSLLGYAQECPEILMSAFRYLAKHGGGVEFFQKHYREKRHCHGD